MERELWKSFYTLARKLDRPWGAWLYSASDVMIVYFWAVVHDRPTDWATVPGNWPEDLRPGFLPSQPTMSRRLRNPDTVELMTTIEQYLLAVLVVRSCLVQIIDGKALAVSGVSKDPDTGYGRGAGAFQKGYKFHAVWGAGPMPVAWGLAPMNTSEKKMARHLIPALPGVGYLLADRQYDVNGLYDLAAEADFQLVTPKTPGKKLGHRRQSIYRLRAIQLLTTAFGRALMKHRNAIERDFGSLTSVGGGLGPLPAWVRRFTRVRNWIQTKLIAAGLRHQILYAPEKLALA